MLPGRPVRAGRRPGRWRTGRARRSSGTAPAPTGGRVADPGQAGQPGVPRLPRVPPYEVAQRAGGQVGGGDAGADVAAGPAEAGRVVQGDRGAPVARHAEDAGPGVVHAHARSARGRGARGSRAGRRRSTGWCARRCRCASRTGTGRRVRRGRCGRRRCAGRTCTRAPCRRAVSRPSQPTAARLRVGQRLRRDHGGVHRQPGAPQAPEVRGEALGAAQDVRARGRCRAG